MPTARSNGIDLYYEIHGSGPQLTLIEGLGYHRWMWYRQVPSFERLFSTLIYDNRGVGKSSKPPGPYTHEQNADDLAALLDHIGWEKTHLLGVSMGGFIAQEFALKYPRRVDKLILVATGFGGPKMIAVPPEAAQAMMPNPTLSPEARIRKAMPLAFGDIHWHEEHADEFDKMVRWRLEEQQPSEAAVAQIMAGATFDTSDRVKNIKADTLVITGSRDGVVPPGNAELLAAKIPWSSKAVIEGAGHLSFIEASEEFNGIVIDFLNAGG